VTDNDEPTATACSNAVLKRLTHKQFIASY